MQKPDSINAIAESLGFEVNTPRSLLNVGFHFWREAKFTQARRCFLVGSEQDGLRGEATFGFGLIAFSQVKIPEAVERFQEAIGLGEPRACGWLAFCAWSSGLRQHPKLTTANYFDGEIRSGEKILVHQFADPSSPEILVEFPVRGEVSIRAMMTDQEFYTHCDILYDWAKRGLDFTLAVSDQHKALVPQAFSSIPIEEIDSAQFARHASLRTMQGLQHEHLKTLTTEDH